MPLRSYDHLFGGKEGSASRAYNSMIRRYGRAEGERIFFAKVNAEKKSKGVGDALTKRKK